MDKILSIDDWLPVEAKKSLAKQAKETRLARHWKRATLSKHTGIPVPTIKRYETTGDISLQQFLKLVFVLGDLDKLKGVFTPEKPFYSSIEEIEKSEAKPKPKRQRGSQ